MGLRVVKSPASGPTVYKCVHAKLLQSCRTLSTPWTINHQAPLSTGFSWSEYISFSRGSSQPRDRTCISYISCTGRQVLYQRARGCRLKKIKNTLLLLLLQGTLREKEGCRNYQITRLCPEVILGKLLDKETIGEAQKEKGFARVYRCGGLTESTFGGASWCLGPCT